MKIILAEQRRICSKIRYFVLKQLKWFQKNRFLFILVHFQFLYIYEYIYGPVTGHIVEIFDRQNKKKTNLLFCWYSKPNATFPFEPVKFKSRVVRQILNEVNIDYFFKLIITPEIVQDITNNTNTRIKQICETTTNAKYLKQRELLLKNSITSENFYWKIQ